MKPANIAPTVNVALLAVLGLQLLSMVDGLTTATVLNLPGGYEANPFYFPLLAVKTLALCMASFLLVGKQLNRKVEFAVLSIAGFLGAIWFLVIMNNVMVIFT